MTLLTEEKCCDECRNDLDMPCPDMVACLVNGPTCHDSDDCRERARMRAAERDSNR